MIERLPPTPTVQPLPWFIPTFHGDIRLERTTDDTTTVRAFELTPTEEAAMRVLRERALSGSGSGSHPTQSPKSKAQSRERSEPWADVKDFAPLEESNVYRSKDGVTILLRAPIAKIQAVLARELKPGKKLLNAYIFADGGMEEVRKAAPTESGEPDELDVPKAGEKQPKAAATVGAPTIGCPAPTFPESEIRATRVLEAFLSPSQLRDYRAHGVIMARGADTGHQYAITHRGRSAVMELSSWRSLYDLTDDHPLCVHDWEVPAPEEMLALLLCVSLPGRESYVRSLPEAM